MFRIPFEIQKEQKIRCSWQSTLFNSRHTQLFNIIPTQSPLVTYLCLKLLSRYVYCILYINVWIEENKEKLKRERKRRNGLRYLFNVYIWSGNSISSIAPAPHTHTHILSNWAHVDSGHKFHYILINSYSSFLFLSLFRKHE